MLKLTLLLPLPIRLTEHGRPLCKLFDGLLECTGPSLRTSKY